MADTMTPAQARAVQRTPIHPGDECEFYCEVQQEYEPPEKRLRRFTGQRVTVVRHLSREEYDGPGPDDSDDDHFETSRAFKVRAQDGTEFTAHVEELNGWDRDLGQFFWPDGTYGPTHDRSFLPNEMMGNSPTGDDPLDPEANLDRQREIIARLIELDDMRDDSGSMSYTRTGECAELGIELAGLVQALNEWRAQGGYPVTPEPNNPTGGVS